MSAALKATDADSVVPKTGVTPSVVVISGAAIVPLDETKRSATSVLDVELVNVNDVPLAAPELKPLSVPDHVPLATALPAVAPSVKFANAATTSA